VGGNASRKRVDLAEPIGKTQQNEGELIMKKLTKVMTLVSTAALALILVACGNSSSSSSSDSKGGTQTVQFFSTKSENGTTYKELIKEFEKANPKIKIEYQSPQNQATVLKTDLAKGTFPDVVSIGGDAVFKSMQDAKVFKDLSNESYAKNVNPTYKKMITSMYSEKGLFIMPYATNASGIIYNKDLFKKAGITELPQSWDELIAAAKKLKAAGITPFGSAYKDAWTAAVPWDQAAANLTPANFTTQRLDNKTTFAKTHKTVMQRFLEVLQYSENDYMGQGYNDVNTAFAQGKIAMMFQGNWAIPEITKLNKNINLDMMVAPWADAKGDSKLLSGVDVGIGIYNKTKVSSAANKWVAFLFEKANAQKYTDEQFAFSAIDGVTQANKTVAGVKADIEAGKVLDFPDHNYPGALDITKPLSQAALNAKNGMSESKNVTESLKAFDTAYDTANVKN